MGSTPSDATVRGNRAGVVGQTHREGSVAPTPVWARVSLPVWAFAVAPVALVGGGILVARSAGWSWLTAIFAGAVGYLVVVDVAWMVTGAITTRRQLRRRRALVATLARTRPREPARKGR